MNCLHIRLLGGFGLSYSSERVDYIRSGRTQALLTYLILHRDLPQPRDHVAFLLWPGSAESQAHTNLRKHLHQLRQALPDAGRYLLIDPQTLQWNTDAPASIDVADFEELGARSESIEALEQAAMLYRGDLLPGSYDEWLVVERERLHQACSEILQTLIVLSKGAGDYEKAARYAERLVQHDPVQEDTYAHLIRIHMLRQDRAAALRVYHRCEDVLQRELGVPPGAALRQLYAELGAAAPGPRNARRAAAPLIGREAEWERLETVWQTAPADTPQCILIEGEPGIGKTRLAEELVAWLVRQGTCIHSANCYPGENRVAFGPVIDWLRADPLLPLDPVWLQELSWLVPELLASGREGMSSPSFIDPLHRQRLHRALLSALLPDGRPCVLFIDNLHWCDGDTLTWLSDVCHMAHQQKLVILVTMLSGTEVDRGDLTLFLDTLRHNRQLVELALLPLNASQSAELAAHIVGERLSPQVSERLYRETEGNPLFVVEVGRVLAGRRSAIDSTLLDDRVWLPSSIHAAVTGRLVQLTPVARDLAGLAAAINREFSFDMLVRLSGHPEPYVLSAIDELWQRHIIRHRPPNSYDFSHDKLRQVAYASLSPALRRMLHRTIAEALALAAPSAGWETWAQIAAHYDRAGMEREALDYYRRGADLAHSLFSNTEAVRLYRRGLELLESRPSLQGLDSITAEMSEGLGDVLSVLGRATEALESYQTAANRYMSARALSQARLHRKSGKVLDEHGEHLEAALHYDMARSLLEALPGPISPESRCELIEIGLERLGNHFLRGDLAEAEELADCLCPIIESFGTPSQRSHYLGCCAASDLRRHRLVATAQTMAIQQAALAAAQESGSASDIALALYGLSVTEVCGGRLADAGSHIQSALANAEAIGWTHLILQCSAYQTLIWRLQGRVDDVETKALRLLAPVLEAGAERDRFLVYANLAWARWRYDDISGAKQDAEKALRVLRQPAYPFCWTALLPLVAATLSTDDLASAAQHAKSLLDPMQQELPEELTAAFCTGLAQWDTDQSDAARVGLQHAVNLAREIGYL